MNYIKDIFFMCILFSSITHRAFAMWEPVDDSDIKKHAIKGHIIYTYGTSTSGKTSLTRELSKLLPGYTVVSTKDLNEKYMAKLIKKACPNEYEFVKSHIDISALLLYIYGDEQIVTSTNNSVELWENLYKIKSKKNDIESIYNPDEQRDYVYSKVFKLAEKSNIIFDNIYVNKFLDYKTHHTIQCDLHMLLVFCPPSLLLERVMKRNELALLSDKTNRRYPITPFRNFIDMFTNTDDEDIVAEIKREDLMSSLRTAYDMSIEMQDDDPLSHCSWEEVDKKIQITFGNNSILNLKSKYHFDSFVDTSKGKPEELALMVFQTLNKDLIKKKE